MADTPRGIRNNNPGNLRRTQIAWQGERQGVTDEAFEEFETPFDGLRALTRNLRNYNTNHGLTTVRQFISRWAPPSDGNDTEAYVRGVSSDMGIDPDAPFDVMDESLMVRMVSSIVRHENGQNPYDEELLRTAVRAGLGIDDGTPPPSGGGDPRAIPNFGNLVAPVPFTLNDEMYAEARMMAARPDFGEALLLAAEQEWAITQAISGFGQPTFQIDPEFRMTSELMEELGDGIPTEYWDQFYNAHSADHARHIRTRLLEALEIENKLAAWGGWGVAMQLGAAILDPVAVGVAVATEGMAAPLLAGAKSTRIGRILSSGLTNAASEAAIESFLVSQRPTGTNDDILYAAAIGFGLGGTFGAFGRARTEYGRRADSLGDEIVRDISRELDTKRQLPRSGGTPNFGQPTEQELPRPFSDTPGAILQPEMYEAPSPEGGVVVIPWGGMPMPLPDGKTPPPIVNIPPPKPENPKPTPKKAEEPKPTSKKPGEKPKKGKPAGKPDTPKGDAEPTPDEITEGDYRAVFTEGADLIRIMVQLMQNGWTDKRLANVYASQLTGMKVAGRGQLDDREINERIVASVRNKLGVPQPHTPEWREWEETLDARIFRDVEKYGPKRKAAPRSRLPKDQRAKLDRTPNMPGGKPLSEQSSAERHAFETVRMIERNWPRDLKTLDKRIAEMEELLASLPDTRLVNEEDIEDALFELDLILSKSDPKTREAAFDFLARIYKAHKIAPRFKQDWNHNYYVSGYGYKYEHNVVSISRKHFKGEWQASDAMLVIHEVAHWAYYNILTYRDRLNFMKAMRKYYNPKTGTRELWRLKSKLPIKGRETDESGEPYGINSEDGPQEFWANQFVAWVASEGRVMHAESIFMSVTRKLLKIYRRWRKKEYVDDDLVKLFKKVLPSAPGTGKLPKRYRGGAGGAPDAYKSPEDLWDAPPEINPKPESAKDPSYGPDGVDMATEYAPVDLNDPALADAPIRSRGGLFKWFRWVRYDVAGAMVESKHPMVRMFGYAAVENPVGLKDRKTLFGASEWRDLTHRRMNLWFHQIVEPQFTKWADRKKLGYFKRGAFSNERENFMVQVGRAKRRLGSPEKLRKFDPEAVEAAKQLHAWFEQYRQWAINPGLMDGKDIPGVRHFDKVPENEEYLPRIPLEDRVRQALDTFELKTLEEFLYRNMKTKNPELEDRLLRRIAKAYWATIDRISTRIDHHKVMGLSEIDAEELKRMILEEAKFQGEAIDEKVLDDALWLVTRPDKEGGHPRSRRRTLLDETYTESLPTKDGGVRNFSLEDIFDDNIETLAKLYNFQMAGAIAMARIGFDSRGAFEAFLERIDRTAKHVGNGYNKKDLDRDLENLKFVWGAVTGQWFGDPPYASNSAQWMRRLRDFNFTRLMGQLGIAQIPELVGVVGAMGITAAMKGMPGMKAMLKRTDGKLEHEFFEEAERIWGFGADRFTGAIPTRLGEIGDGLDPLANKATLRIDKGLALGKKVVTEASAFAAINSYAERWAMAAATIKMARLAKGLTKESRRRLEAEGLDPEMLDRIKAQLDEHAPDLHKRLGRVNLDKWTDREAAAHFIMTIQRRVRRAVLQGDVGGLHRYMSHPAAQVIFQFRKFMLLSYSKALLHGVHVRDWYTFANWMTGMFGAAMAYIAQTQMNSIGREDRKKYLRDRLSTEAIALAAFQRTGFSSLIPMVTDLTFGRAVEDGVFDYRTSSLPSDAILGNPTVDLIGNIGGTLGTVAGIFNEDRDYSVADNRAIFGSLMFNNLTIIRNFINWMEQDLPRESFGN